MLVLSRKIGEVITVGSSVKVTVLSYDRGVVRLGIEAPKTIPVHRKEVHDKIVEMNKKAALTKVSALKDAINKSSVIFDKFRFNGVTKNEINNIEIDKSLQDKSSQDKSSLNQNKIDKNSKGNHKNLLKTSPKENTAIRSEIDLKEEKEKISKVEIEKEFIQIIDIPIESLEGDFIENVSKTNLNKPNTNKSFTNKKVHKNIKKILTKK
jgi:carbon storage regulator